MINTSDKVQCYLLVPVIFAGFTALAALVTYQIILNPPDVFRSRSWLPYAAGAILAGTAFLTGVLIVRLLLKPVEKFVDQANTMMPEPEPEVRTVRRTAEDFSPFAQTLDRVTEVLSNVEAHALFPEIVAPSPSMRALLGVVLKIAPTDSTVLLQGESGTGKELVARAIHARSRRAAHPFVAINCAGIPEGLLESELFGYEKGAFTGAYARHTGKFEAAAGGTVLLDEIGDMPMLTQAKILRALQEREIERVGANQPIPIDIRVVAATNRDLQRMVAEGKFREDLYFRINVVSIRLPPLRERSEDIPLLAMHLLRQIKPGTTIAPMALAALVAHDWPGNVRELRNTIEAAAALADETIEPRHLGVAQGGVKSGWAGATAPGISMEKRTLDQQLDALEKGMILEALSRTDGIQVRAAELLGIKERSLWHRIAKHHIDVTAFREQKAD